jgi:hypothetical protein
MLGEMAMKFGSDYAGLFGEVDGNPLIGSGRRGAPACCEDGGARAQ